MEATKVANKKRKDIEEKEKWKAENEFRKTLLQVSGGLILILSLTVTWRGMNQSQKNIETGHQITRFNQAIKFLSEKSSTLKLGGLYTLEHIVRESPEHYLGSVIEILSSFVKDAEVIYPKDFESWKTKYAPKDREVQRLYKNKFKKKWEFSIDDFNRWLKEQDDKNEELKNLFEKIYILKPETQVAITVLGRIRTYENYKYWKNLPPVNLSGSKFRGVNLTGADLSDANLTDAKLLKADLTDADLLYAYLTVAKLTVANLRGADLSYAKLFDAEGLTVEQLLKAKTLYKVKGLPPEIEKELRKKGKKRKLFD